MAFRFAVAIPLAIPAVIAPAVTLALPFAAALAPAVAVALTLTFRFAAAIPPAFAVDDSVHGGHGRVHDRDQVTRSIGDIVPKVGPALAELAVLHVQHPAGRVVDPATKADAISTAGTAGTGRSAGPGDTRQAREGAVMRHRRC